MVNIVRMNGRLKLIEQQLVGINDAVFQNLCDTYLILREKHQISFNRTGSQIGKQKTVKGSPDTYFRNQSGGLILVEFTTVASDIIKKLKGDILKCLDYKVVKIDKEKIEKIILFFNSKLKINQEEEVVKFSQANKVDIELIGLDKLALDIFTEYHILAKDFLGLPVETGQILPIDSFVAEYNHKAGNLSTPLDNPFLGRVAELQRVGQALKSKDLVMLSGPAGVGKTKFGLEAVKQFLAQNNDYTSYVIVKKDIDIWEDLRLQLHTDNNYIILVDDANRQMVNFLQLLGIFKEKRKGTIKIVITVRNYALDDIMTNSDNVDSEVIDLPKFTDDEIRNLISNDYFKVKHSKYQDKIVELADGNSRLAIMAAKLALEEQYEFLKGGVYHLYDNYFRTFIKDFDLFNNTAMLKTIGIVSFFFTLKRDDKLFLEKLLHTFELDHNDFQESLEELSRRELIEISGINVRIAEQVMSTYFFYKVFIKDQKLSFNKLLLEYVEAFQHRFNETVILSNNTFGYKEMLEKIQKDLSKYFHMYENNDEKIVPFIKLFWFYMRDESIAYIYKKVNQIEEVDSPVYDSHYDTNDFVFEDDKLLALLTPFFRSYAEDSFSVAVELSFEYARRNPIVFPELIRRLKENCSFDDDDEFNNTFEKQRELSEILISRSKENQLHYEEAFLGLATIFLKHTNRVFKTSRKNNAFIHYQYKVPLNETVKTIKVEVWNYLFTQNNKYPERILKIINDWKPFYLEVDRKTLALDLPLIIGFIENKLNRRRFEDVHFVQDFLEWLKIIKPRNVKYQDLHRDFINDEFVDFAKFEWTRNRHRRNRKIGHNQFAILKAKEISKHFVFNERSEFKRFGVLIKNNLIASKDHYRNLNSYCVIMENTFKKDKKLGFEMLKYFMRSKFHNNVPIPYKVICLLANDSEYGMPLWKFLKQWKHKDADRFKLTFFEALEDPFVTSYYTKEFYKTVNGLDSRASLNFNWLHKFSAFSKTIFSDFLNIIYHKKLQNIEVDIDYDFFENFTLQLREEIDILQKLYLHEVSRLRGSFDYERTGLKVILSINKDFIFEFIKLFYFNGKLMNSKTDDLNFIWELLDEDDLEKLFQDIISNTVQIGIGDEEVDMFFHNLSGANRDTALEFLNNMIVKWCKDIRFVNCIIRLVRRYFRDQLEYFLFKYLANNKSVDDFSEIYWRGNGGTYSGDVSVGEIQANEWLEISKMLDKKKNQLDLIPIKSYVKQRINDSLEYAEQEKVRRFRNPRYW